MAGLNFWGPSSGRQFSAKTLPPTAAKRVAAVQQAVQAKQIPAVVAITKMQQYSSVAHHLTVASTVPVAQSLQSGAAEGYVALGPAARNQPTTQAFLIAHFFGGQDVLSYEDEQLHDLEEGQSILEARVDDTQQLFGPFKELADRAYKAWVEAHRASDGSRQGAGARLEEVIMLRGKNREEVEILSICTCSVFGCNPSASSPQIEEDADEEREVYGEELNDLDLSSSSEAYIPLRGVAQTAIIRDVLHVVLKVLDASLKKSVSELGSESICIFDGQHLFSWFRTLIAVYQTSFLSICRRLKRHPTEHIPFGVQLWQVHLRDVLMLTVLGGQAVGRDRNQTTELSISLGIHTNADLRNGMVNLKLGCVLGGNGPFAGLMSLNLENETVRRAVQTCKVLPFDACLKAYEASLQGWLTRQDKKVPPALSMEIKRLRESYAGTFGARFWDNMPALHMLDMPPTGEVTSAEALMGVSRPKRAWTLDCNLQSPHIVSGVVVVLPWKVKDWAQAQLARALAAQRNLAEEDGSVAVRAEELLEPLLEGGADVVMEDDDEEERAAAQEETKRCTLIDTARMLLMQAARDWVMYVLGRWTHKTGRAGNPPGRQAMKLAAAMEEQWNNEKDAPYLCIYNKAFWQKAQESTPQCPSLSFSKSTALSKRGPQLFHFGMQLLTMLESPLWKGTAASDMLGKALTLQDDGTRQYERVALATAMKAVLSGRFPIDTVFVLHCMSDGKFTGAFKLWEYR